MNWDTAPASPRRATGAVRSAEGGPSWIGIGLLSAVLVLRLLYAWRVELMPEEAYYWNYAQHLDYGYLDHPPMVAWLIAAGWALLRHGELAVRLGALCCGTIAGYFTYRLSRELFDQPSAWMALLLGQTLPFFFLSGVLMTPDAPLVAAWAGALYFLQRALIAGRATAWYGAGLCLGLGLLSKYTIALLGVAALVFMLLDARSRRWLKRFEPYAAAALALALFSPVIVWNAHHEWASFAFQTSRRLALSAQFALPKLIGSALLLLTPTGLAAVVWLLFRRSLPDVSGEVRDVSGEVRDGLRAWRFIQVTTLLPLAVFVLFSLRREVKLDWTGAPWVAALPALGYGFAHAGAGAGLWIRRAWGPTLLMLVAFYGAALYDLTRGIPGVGYGRHAELVPIGWRQLGAKVHALAHEIAERSGREPLIVGMDRYAIASELAFYAPDRAESVSDTSSGNLFGQMGLMYERWFPPARQSGRDMLLVAWNRADLSQPALGDYAERLDPIGEGRLARDGELIRPFYYRLAHGYRARQPPGSSTAPAPRNQGLAALRSGESARSGESDSAQACEPSTITCSRTSR
ncbi:MAG TPA: glycosyltransferase family 39 protein [Steroidobacteraceae bacterium]|nr:glycosyltransferase family 39 protein [Steroidobacteraceae bacterium]